MRTFVASSVLLLIGLSLPSTARAAALIKTQPICPGTGGNCSSFSDSQRQPILREFSFVAPSKGTASVTFHGHVDCNNPDMADRLVDFETQIVTVSGLVAKGGAPGGHQHKALIPGLAALTFILNATRVFSIGGAGTQTYYFKTKQNAVPPPILCAVFTATFSVIFIP